MDGGEGQFVVLDRIDLPLEQIRGEVKAARHRQAGVLEPKSHLLGHQQAVGACIHHHMAGKELAAGSASRGGHHHLVTVPVRGDGADLGAHLDRQLAPGAGHRGPSLGHKRFRQSLVINGGVSASNPNGHQFIGTQAAIGQGHLGLPFGNRLLLEELHRRKMGGKLLKSLAQKLAFLLPNPEDHLRGAKHAALPRCRVE